MRARTRTQGRAVGPLARALAVVTMGLLLTAGAARGQELAGTAFGPDGQPLQDVSVVLHRISDGGGAFIATDTTDASGAFSFELEADSAVYFAAIRYDGAMYLGPTVQGVSTSMPGYEIRVDPANEAGAVASALSGPSQGPMAPGGAAAAQRPRGDARPGSSDTGALLLVGFLALAAAGAFFLAAPRYRQRRTREALMELAALENRLADDPDDRERLERERDRLRERLAPRD